MAVKFVYISSEFDTLGGDTEATPNTHHDELPPVSEPIQGPTTQVVAGLHIVEGDDADYINTRHWMVTATISITVDAPGWLALMFYFLLRFIQVMTRTRIRVHFLQLETSDRPRIVEDHLSMLQIMSTEQVKIGVDAPGWVALMMFYWSRFIQMATGTRLRIRLLEDVMPMQQRTDEQV